MASSYGSEFWSLKTALHYICRQQFSLPTTIHLVGDNEQVVNLFHLAASASTVISTHPQGSELKYLTAMLFSHPNCVSLTLSWVKAHVRFRDSQLLDPVGELAASFLPTSSMPPPPQGSISRGSCPALGKITTASIRHVTPQHQHTTIHKPSSFNWLHKTFTQSKKNFQWVTNSYCVSTYSHHYDLYIYICPHCFRPHPIDPTSVIALCQASEDVREEFMKAWPLNTQKSVRHWFNTLATLSEKKKHFICTMLPSSLLQYLADQKLPVPTTLKSSDSWQQLLQHHHAGISTAVKSAIKWLHGHPTPCFVHTKSGPNPWSSDSPFSTSFSRPAKCPFSCAEPGALPDTITKKTVSSKSKKKKTG